MQEKRLKALIEEANKTKREYRLYNTNVFVSDYLPDNVSLARVLQKLKKHVPYEYFYNLDQILVGQFDFLKKREINSAYHEGVIYVTNEQSSDDDMIEDLVHEIAHLVEERHPRAITGALDMGVNLKSEFMSKRIKLFDILKRKKYNVEGYHWHNTEFNQEVDEFLFTIVGYDVLRDLARGIFLTPYSVTSVHEYFAVGFEYYYLKDRLALERMCPYLYMTLEETEEYMREDL